VGLSVSVTSAIEGKAGAYLSGAAWRRDIFSTDTFKTRHILDSLVKWDIFLTG